MIIIFSYIPYLYDLIIEFLKNLIFIIVIYIQKKPQQAKCEIQNSFLILFFY